MKTKTLLLALAIPAMTVSTAGADPNYTVIGSALGAVAGAVVANNVCGVNKFVAIPAGALIGGVIGNQYNHRDRYDYYGRNGNYRHNGYYGYNGYGYYDADYRPKVIVIEQPAAAPTAIADPHPGVDLIKVSILNSNGIRTDVPILRTAGKFVGPQGETYATLPKSAELARRYGM